MLDNTVARELERTANERAQRLSDYRERTEKLEAEIERLEAENATLREIADRLENENAVHFEAIEKHAAMGHERCHENDVELYAAFGIAQDLSLPPKEKFLGECERYWECRKSGVKEWPSVTQLQSEVDALREDKARLDYLIGLRRPYFSQRNGIVALIGTNSEGKRVVGVGGNAREAIDFVRPAIAPT